MKALRSRMFALVNNIPEAVVQWFRQQFKEFFADWIHRLLRWGYRCLNARGDLF
jgi:hypothetical protein